MKKAKHTPGPWSAMVIGRNNMDRGTVMVATTYRDGMAIDCFNSGSTFAESAANAHLIAAAPELLEALQRLLNEAHPNQQYVNGHPAAEAARAAIAKATGN
jgi:2-oxo-4-hydroxy-4-carboxy--5-ureidoimidazoline (OHCU) decarboxylase